MQAVPAMNRALAGWIVIGLVALAWELLGVFDVADIWPLTSLVRDAMAHTEIAVLVVCLAVVGFPAWLAYHFLIEPRRYPGSKP